MRWAFWRRPQSTTAARGPVARAEAPQAWSAMPPLQPGLRNPPPSVLRQFSDSVQASRSVEPMLRPLAHRVDRSAPSGLVVAQPTLSSSEHQAPEMPVVIPVAELDHSAGGSGHHQPAPAGAAPTTGSRPPVTSAATQTTLSRSALGPAGLPVLPPMVRRKSVVDPSTIPVSRRPDTAAPRRRIVSVDPSIMPASLPALQTPRSGSIGPVEVPTAGSRSPIQPTLSRDGDELPTAPPLGPVASGAAGIPGDLPPSLQTGVPERSGPDRSDPASTLVNRSTARNDSLSPSDPKRDRGRSRGRGVLGAPLDAVPTHVISPRRAIPGPTQPISVPLVSRRQAVAPAPHLAPSPTTQVDVYHPVILTHSLPSMHEATATAVERQVGGAPASATTSERLFAGPLPMVARSAPRSRPIVGHTAINRAAATSKQRDTQVSSPAPRPSPPRGPSRAPGPQPLLAPPTAPGSNFALEPASRPPDDAGSNGPRRSTPMPTVAPAGQVERATVQRSISAEAPQITPVAESAGSSVQRVAEVAAVGADPEADADESKGDDDQIAQLARKIAPLVQRDLRQRLLTERERAGHLTSRF
jgi:hypothetical protein